MFNVLYYVGNLHKKFHSAISPILFKNTYTFVVQAVTQNVFLICFLCETFCFPKETFCFA